MQVDIKEYTKFGAKFKYLHAEDFIDFFLLIGDTFVMHSIA